MLELIHREIWWKDSNFILLINGMPGRGKSTVAEYIMWAFDRKPETFAPRASLLNWTTSNMEFKQAIDRNAGDRGRAITWEEANVGGLKDGGISSRRFMTTDNLQIASLFQTFRYLHHLIILTFPNKSRFELQARELAHAVIHVMRNNGDYSTNQFYVLEMNPVFNKTYIKNLKFIRDGRLKTQTSFLCGMPPASWADLCQEKSDWAKSGWRKQMVDKKEEPKIRKLFKPLTLKERIFEMVAVKPTRSTMSIYNEVGGEYQYVAAKVRAAKGQMGVHHDK